jgi:hypothetical protein
MKTIFSSILVCATLLVNAQTWEWSNEISIPKKSTTASSLIPLPNQQVQMIGSGSSFYTSDLSASSEGSYFRTYNSSGSLEMSRQVGASFFIQKAVYDGASHYYFCGFFYGSQTIDGISINSTGAADAMIGKMNMDGSLVWMRTMGDGNADVYMDLMLNSQGSVYVCGTSGDSVCFNGVLQQTAEESGIVSEYSLNGELVSYKLYDRVPGRTGYRNLVWEIEGDSNGHLYILWDSDGQAPDGSETIPQPELGRYVSRLDAALNEQWTRYIVGPASYYGYSCSALVISANGDPYVCSFASGHYGGDGFVHRLNAGDGSVSWQLPNVDGTYSSACMMGTSLVLAGTENANGCPCPDFSDGEQVIRIIDENNITLNQIYVDNSKFNNVAAGASGEIYLYSSFRDGSCVYGSQTLVNGYSDPSVWVPVLSKLNAAISTEVQDEQVAVASLDVYPNPGTGIFRISADDNESTMKNIRVLDSEGRMIWNSQVPASGKILNKEVDLSQQPKGIYFVILETDRGRRTARLLVN